MKIGPPESPWHSPCCLSPSTSTVPLPTAVTITSTQRLMPTPPCDALVAPNPTAVTVTPAFRNLSFSHPWMGGRIGTCFKRSSSGKMQYAQSFDPPGIPDVTHLVAVIVNAHGLLSPKVILAPLRGEQCA